MEMSNIDLNVKRVKLKTLRITNEMFQTEKGWVFKNNCIYAYPPYIGQRIWVKENKLH
tara:strand:- start:342 stop:515 length:174 start_codon:yes stop_codon:yes gene_type:complete